MPAYKVSELSIASALSDTDTLYVIHNSLDAQITGAALKSSIIGSGAVSVSTGKTLTVSDSATIAARRITLAGGLIFSNYTDPTATGFNVFIGELTGNTTLSPGGGSATLSSYNTGMGNNVLTALTTGYQNQAYGTGALASVTTGYNNNAYGIDTLGMNTTGNSNTGYGVDAMPWNSTGAANAGFGMNALWSNTIGDANAAGGYSSLLSATAGTRLTAFGSYSDLFAPDASAVTLTLSAGTANLGIGRYCYKFSYILNGSETELSWLAYLAATTDAGHREVTIGNLPVYSGPLTCTGRKIYRTKVGAPVYGSGPGAVERHWYYVATVADNTTTSFVDTVADASQGLENTGISNTIMLGSGAKAYKNNQFVLGDHDSPITEMWVGSGVYSSVVYDVLFSVSGASGANVAGPNLIISGGPGTGSQPSGSVIFKTAAAGGAGSLWNAVTERWRIDGATGKLSSVAAWLGVGTVPTAPLHVLNNGTIDPIASFAGVNATDGLSFYITHPGAVIQIALAGGSGQFLSTSAQHDAIISGQSGNNLLLGVGSSEWLRINSAGSITIGTVTDGMTAGGSLAIAKDLAHRGTNVGFFNHAVAVQPTTASFGVWSTLANVVTALQSLGILGV